METIILLRIFDRKKITILRIFEGKKSQFYEFLTEKTKFYEFLMENNHNTLALKCQKMRKNREILFTIYLSITITT